MFFRGPLGERVKRALLATGRRRQFGIKIEFREIDVRDVADARQRPFDIAGRVTDPLELGLRLGVGFYPGPAQSRTAL
jgi:hypothetical protein